MKKLFTIAILALSINVFGQYSNATLNGPWMVYKSSIMQTIVDSTAFVVFDGNGNIVDWAGFGGPFTGTYTVQSNGTYTGTLIDNSTSYLFSGQLTSQTTGNLFFTGGPGIYNLKRITYPGALMQTLTGVFTTPGCGQKNITLQINDQGQITSYSGLITQVSGRVFVESGIFLGFINTGEAYHTGWDSFIIIGNMINDSLIGTLKTTNNSCQNGIVRLKRTGIADYTPPAPLICAVTVDTLSWKNKIMWEKTIGISADHFNIYKEVSTNVYNMIGTVPYSDPTVFTDYSSSPESFSNRYKITVVDNSSRESLQSYYHKTINLTIAAFGSTMGLNWNDYVDASGMYICSDYFIYRGTNINNMQLFDTVPGGTNSYNDNNVFNVYYYLIGVKKNGGCNTSKSDFVSYSNKKDNTAFIGISENLYGTIKVSPNPFSEQTTIEIPNFQNSNSKSQITITDMAGKTVRTYSNLFTRHSELVSESSQNPQQIATNLSGSRNDAQFVIERGNLKPGVYFVELRGDRVYRGKLVVD